MSVYFESAEDNINPLDHVEEVLLSHNWVFNRMTEDELMVQVTGRGGKYRLYFIWQQHLGAMQLCCHYDFFIPAENYGKAGAALMTVNEALWMGHFDLPRDTGVPSFRHTSLMRGMTSDSGAEHIEDMVDIALAQCERYYPVFYLLSGEDGSDDQSLSLALMQTAGES